MIDPISSIDEEVCERVNDVANLLYQQNNFEKFPTVDEVRKRSKADMNSVCALMKHWRKAQTTHTSPITVVIPDSVQQPYLTLVNDLVSQNTVATLAQLLTQATRGEVIGLAFVAVHKGMDYSTGVVGAAYSHPTFSRGAVAMLDDELLKMVIEHSQS